MPQTRARALVATVVAALTATTLAPASLAQTAAVPGMHTTAVATAQSAVTAASGTNADNRIHTKLGKRVTVARFGKQFSGVVMDASANRIVWSKNLRKTLMPASTTKLVTAFNALTVFGPDTRFVTRVRRGPRVNQVTIQGFGDPSLTSADVDLLASATAAYLKARGVTMAHVYADDDVFPTPSLAVGWKASYVPDSIAPVRALVRDQRNTPDTTRDAALYFRARLKAHGIARVTYDGRRDVARDATTVATVRGDALSDIVSRMLLHSDNEIAETLHKLVGRQQGVGTSWSRARTAQSRVLTRKGLAVGALYDGSGLSRSDRMSSLQLARVVMRGVNPRATNLAVMRQAAAIPTAGQTGTLAAKYGRFTTRQSRCAAGKVWAKTGSLSDVVALAGFTVGADGRLKVFAFLVNGKDSTLKLKQQLDMLAATVKGCY
ncbi:D-alanyl-D-alanine carboxypeptidase [Phycicoccus endophyticus]|uniref:D-alanyl-D-alanine carboxypeptidase n=1 Tax=Phycicoccus endophyticus TaxID=1690220 RepID=A0A7G9R1G5_9MICO|nr:D-alanyl-D-alanine carboxypeptidase [Phycicoccus endophyticus]NHI18773.1 D-alanyl-D-alanine carboxypeptidase/D-alanyl-D-alanine-endopeptidase [Phycicoccus endophyticus]QNN49440.1 D-alanyl-D-alanine carboxypeptidase [Phycicoccus endophyticus]GGL36686.1 peptidase S13 [Phycicoccus endophyticus]